MIVKLQACSHRGKVSQKVCSGEESGSQPEHSYKDLNPSDRHTWYGSKVGDSISW